MMPQAPAPYAYIIEQPAPKSLRFRYECEGRSAGSIPGVNSSPDNKTFPTIKICGYKGSMIIVVSCVTKDEPYKPHPHNLVGRDCQMGVCTVKVKTDGDDDSCQVHFKNLGIQCVKRRDIADALRVRQDLRVDPFRSGFGHRSQPQSIDLNAVRLCFQVFLTDDAYKVQRALAPVASDVIYDKKAMSDLLIVRASHCSGPLKGGTTLILLCEKVTREDTEVWFYREENGQLVWSERGHVEFVHKQLAIVLKTPPYRDLRLSDHVMVQFQLRRLSDGGRSNSFSFEYIPDTQDKEIILGNKRRKKLSYNLQEYDENLLSDMAIKAEPRDRTPPHPMMNAPYQEQWAGGAGEGYAWGSPSYARSPHAPDTQIQPMASPGRAAPYSLHVHQQPTGLHMQNIQVHSPLGACVSPAHSPILMHNMPANIQGNLPGNIQGNIPGNLQGNMQSNLPGNLQSNLQGNMPGNMTGMSNNMGNMAMPVSMQAGMCMQTMDPVMADVGQQAYTQLDGGNTSSPSLSALLMNPCDVDVQFNSTDLSNLSSMLKDDDLSENLIRLTTRDPHQP